MLFCIQQRHFAEASRSSSNKESTMESRASTPAENVTSRKSQMLQDPFLNTLRREHVPVSIYLVNGIKLQGQVESFDAYVILLRNVVTQMVYKHAVSTIVPGRSVNFSVGSEEISAGPERS